MSVTFRRDDPVGLVAIVGDLLTANLARDPGRRRLLRDEASALRAIDAGVDVTLRCTPSGVVVTSGADPGAPAVTGSGTAEGSLVSDRPPGRPPSKRSVALTTSNKAATVS